MHEADDKATSPCKAEAEELKFSTNSKFILLTSTIRRSLIQKRKLKLIDKSLFGKSKRLLFIMISSEFVLTKDKPEKKWTHLFADENSYD